MLKITVKRLHSNVTGAQPKAVFRNDKDEAVAHGVGTFLLFGDVPAEVKCTTMPADAVCEYTVEAAQ
jgi:hypothetical protein